MADSSILQAVEAFVALLAALALVALLTRRVGVPYTVALVLLGFAISAAAPPIHLQVSPDLVLAVLLPGLVFEAAYQLDERELRRALGGVLLLAIPGVLVVAGFVALVLHVATGMGLGPGFVVGAMVSATDPVAVTASVRRLRAPERLATMVEAESLLNDGTGIVAFTIAVAAMTGIVDPVHGAVQFVGVMVGSVLLGLLAGVVVSRVAAVTDDHLVELTLTLIAAYGTYLLADRLGISGIIATVVAGVVLGSYGRRTGLSARVQDAIDIVWEFFAFLLSALVFLLIGLAIPVGQLAGALVPVAWGVVAILVGRAAVVYLMLGGASWLGRRSGRSAGLPTSWLHVMFWAGLRGAVAVALALSLPEAFPDRGMLQGITFGVVLFTLLAQATTADLVVRRSGAREHGAWSPAQATDGDGDAHQGESDPLQQDRTEALAEEA